MGEILQELILNEPPCNTVHIGLGHLSGSVGCEAGRIPCSSVTDTSATAVVLEVPVDGCALPPPADDVGVDGLDVCVVANVATSSQPADPSAVVGSLVGDERVDATAMEAMGPLAAMAVSAASLIGESGLILVRKLVGLRPRVCSSRGDSH